LVLGRRLEVAWHERIQISTFFEESDWVSWGGDEEERRRRAVGMAYQRDANKKVASGQAANYEP
jgi:hypothetical protein